MWNIIPILYKQNVQYWYVSFSNEFVFCVLDKFSPKVFTYEHLHFISVPFLNLLLSFSSFNASCFELIPCFTELVQSQVLCKYLKFLLRTPKENYTDVLFVSAYISFTLPNLFVDSLVPVLILYSQKK